MLDLYIDDVLVSISKVKNPPSGAPKFCEVFVNDFSSRHLLPKGVCTFDRKISFKTGGYSYAIK